MKKINKNYIKETDEIEIKKFTENSKQPEDPTQTEPK